MKRLALCVLVVVGVLVGGVAVARAVSGPEVDRANATLSLKGQLATATCAGEDGVKYTTYRGALTGSETETTPGFTDYVLTGTVTIPDAVWTVNLKTKRGLLNATINMVNSAGAPTYNGKIVLITQGLPTATTATPLPARGWIEAQTFTNGAADGGELLANVASQLAGPASALSLSGVFGNNPAFPKIANYAVIWNGLTC